MAEAAVQSPEGQRVPIPGGTLTINVDGAGRRPERQELRLRTGQFELAVANYVITTSERLDLLTEDDLLLEPLGR
ncbi:hypothetical protein [Ornithinimicrobium pratense]|uniref:Uncharacterized protein n=1 Tax=Ornithinimicrobium pratense TaxID=2593973 RepID=A0A5J6V4V6_9MICO|nr:hypothetical protein [Ornithinimicrobium pratense]QFG68206.1 hypothetical protein FY030_05290 [Ornithinimicrobium pratense]